MKNVFDQTICDPNCPAWNEADGFCDANLNYAGRVGVVEGAVVFGVLCRIPEKYKISRRKEI